MVFVWNLKNKYKTNMFKIKFIYLFLFSLIFAGCNIQKQCERDLLRAKLNCPELFKAKVDTFYKVQIDTLEVVTVDTLIFFRDISDSELISIRDYNDSIYKLVVLFEETRGSISKDSINIARLKFHVKQQEKYILLLKQRLKSACKDLVINKQIDRTIKKDSTISINSKNTAIIQDKTFRLDHFLLGVAVGFLVIFILIWVYKKVNNNE